MPTPTRLLLLLLLAVATLRASDSLEHARRAQALLGHDTWSQVIRIENSARYSRYPPTVYALIFELADLLWFYTDTDGTQSFSLHTNRLAQEKADYGPLLCAIEPGFARWSVLTPAPPLGGISPGDVALPNACFIESIAALRTRAAVGVATPNARLLSYYVRTRAGVIGHTVLAYDTQHAIEIIDPARIGRVLSVPRAKATSALAIARAIDRARVMKARELPLTSAAPTLMAATTPASAPAIVPRAAELALP